MKAQIGPIPHNEDFNPDDGWQTMKEPPAWVVLWLLGVPVGLGLFFALAWVIIRYTSLRWII